MTNTQRAVAELILASTVYFLLVFFLTFVLKQTELGIPLVLGGFILGGVLAQWHIKRGLI